MGALTKKVLRGIEDGSLQTWQQIHDFAVKYYSGGIAPWQAQSSAKTFVTYFKELGYTV